MSEERREECRDCIKQCAEHNLRGSAQDEIKADVKKLKEETIPGMKKTINRLLGMSVVVGILFGTILSMTIATANDLHKIQPIVTETKSHLATFPEREASHHETSTALKVMASEMRFMNKNIEQIGMMLQKHIDNTK